MLCSFLWVLSDHVGVWLSFGKAVERVGEWCNMCLKTKTKPWLTKEFSIISSWAQKQAVIRTEMKKNLSVHNHISVIPLDSAVFFQSDNKETQGYAIMASDLCWSKPCFAQCALGATWQDQCLCGCIQRPHGCPCPWAEIIWALHWITNPNPQHSALYVTYSYRHTSNGMLNGHLLRWTRWKNTEEVLFDLGAESLAQLHFGDS